MHELGIAQSILDAVETELRPHPGARAVKIGVTVGEFAGVDRDSVAFCFEAIVKGTPFEALVLDLREGTADELELSYLELEEPTDDDDNHGALGAQSPERERPAGG
jgi:Zn finger protein HypA/HybF involved in hydrogenase expression